MKKGLAALGTLLAMTGGTWFLYGALSADSHDTTEEKADSPKLEPFESESLEVSSKEPTQANETTDRETRTPERKANGPSASPEDEQAKPPQPKTNEDETSTSSEPVDTKAVVLNVEREDSSDDSNDSRPTGQTRAGRSPERGATQSGSKDPTPKLSPEVREALMKNLNQQTIDLQKLPSNLENLPSSGIDQLPKRNR